MFTLTGADSNQKERSENEKHHLKMSNMHKFSSAIRILKQGWEMFRWLRALGILAKNLGPIPSIHMAADSGHTCSSKGYDGLFWLHGHQAHTQYTDVQTRETVTYTKQKDREGAGRPPKAQSTWQKPSFRSLHKWGLERWFSSWNYSLQRIEPW